ncbi:hypothetical protein A2936_02155 [Candidatus Uhrbacteria bacterium RIFCSPLOWO2_01_FULL_47_25]|uniref:HEPN domain-containing protein n=2 Tax=Patescibacteria group TaxID=1783273 RepID=A0A1F7UUA3_9BACT|nr:MAG: hypothetical protein A2693_03920 [Candidatus Curtissbacteria bacterium RIFCSPHIGHO2_01_FULL_40_12]OGL81304.1 MAG: hypothetical protein A2936_02155 [Candidatus Uhrbacteria bacterium RIFCSPLOWO2_01_FULL_47_25]
MPYKDKSADWLFFAESDLKTAKAAFKEKIYHIVCFHCHQTMEKSFKAVLARHQRQIPKIHFLAVLFASIVPLEKPKLPEEEVLFMDRFYFPTRYPDTLPGSLPEGLPDKADAAKALEIAEKTLALIKNLLAKKKL